MKKTKLLLSLAITLICLSSTYAASFTPGNIVVTRVGPTISTTGAKAYLDEYTISGVLVQTIALPTDFYVPATSDCGLTSLSGDGQYLALSGMPAAQLTTTAATAYARKILTVNYDGTIAAYTPTVTTPVTTSTISAQTNSGSNTFTLKVANASIAVGQYVFASSIPIGTTVTAISGTSLTLSANALANIASGQTLVFMTSDTPLYSNLRAPKGVFTTDGSNFWLGSEEKYIQYFNPNVNGGVPTNIVADDARYLTSVNGILHKAVRYSKEIATIGTSTNPFPTTAATAVNTSIINSSNDAHQIIAVDVDATVDGQDVMYVAENKGVAGSSWGINKYSKVGTTWTSNGGFGAFADAYMGVTAKVTAPGIVTIYTISRPNIASGYDGGHLTKYVDNAGYNVAPNLTETTVLQSFNQATSPKGGAWRSVNLVPENKNKSISSSTSISSLNITPSTNITVTSELTIDAPRTVNSVTVAAGGKLTMSGGALTATNGITLESTASGTATLMDSYSTPTVNATVKQYVTAGRNWYMSAPVNNKPDNFSVLNRGASVQEYNEATGLWVIKTSGTLTRGKGYIQVAGSTEGSTGTVDFTGTTNSGNVTVALTNNADGGKGFNLVGNPYPSYLNWNFVATDASNTHVTTGAKMPTGTIWYRTVNYNGKSAWTATTTYALDDVVYNGTRFYKVTSPGESGATGGPTGNTTSTEGTVTWAYQGSIYIFATVNADGEVSPETVSNLIPPMQAFWVKSTGGTLTFKNTMRSHETVTNKLKAPKAIDKKIVRLRLTNGASADESVIYSSANALNSFDSYDAPKYFNTAGSNQPEIYSQVGSEKLAINALNDMSIGTEIQLGFLTDKANSFSISASEIKNFDSNTHIILKDKLQKTEFNLSNGESYNFSSDVVTNSDRFSLLFRAPGVTTAIDNASKTNTHVFVNAANQITIIAAEKANYAIYNAVGMLVDNGQTTANIHTAIPIAIGCKLQTGIYVVKVNNQSTRVIIK
jgi:hypothetical protein